MDKWGKVICSITAGSPVVFSCGCGVTRSLFASLATDTKALLVTTPGMLKRGTVNALFGKEPRCAVRTIASNPDLNAIEALREEFRETGLTHVVGMGGGSALDTSKLLAYLLTPQNTSLTLRSLVKDPTLGQDAKIKLTLVPTTSGTGSEVTPYACLWDKSGAAKYKYTFASPTIVANASYLDPDLTVSVPRSASINAALDTCSHAIETLWNKNATDVSIRYANIALGIWIEALPRVLADLENREARHAMQWASVAAGRAISISKTAIAHSISYPVTYHFGVPHGLACAFALKRLAEAVSAKEAWMPGTDAALLTKVFALYDTLQTDEALKQYCSWKQICRHTGEMFTPGRSDSFVLPEADVRALFVC